jgi:mRNA-degrading endonuclease toxin of MazEF toxin-antitoxin module
MPAAGTAAFESVTAADKTLLGARLTPLSAERMQEVCRSMGTAIGC